MFLLNVVPPSLGHMEVPRCCETSVYISQSTLTRFHNTCVSFRSVVSFGQLHDHQFMRHGMLDITAPSLRGMKTRGIEPGTTSKVSVRELAPLT